MFEINTGVKQGSVLSPILFIVYMDKIIKLVNGEERDSFRTLAYADDDSHWEFTENELQSFLEDWNRVIKLHGMKINMEKQPILRRN